MTRLSQIGIGVLLLLAGLAGCRQHCFMTEENYKHYRDLAMTATQPCMDTGDLQTSVSVSQVSTVLNPEAKKRYISLAEAIALALENGRTGEFFDRGGRRTSVVGLQRQGPASNATDSIRVFAYDPAIAGTEIEESLAKFDAQWRTSMIWNKVDRPVGTALETFQAGAVEVIQQDTFEGRTQLLKPLPTGGLAGITFRTEYDFSNLQQRVNPAYRPALEFNFEQPLLQGAGVGINQLRTTHPGGVQDQVSVGGRVPGILLTRIFHEQANVEFESRVHDLLFAVEETYWELYSAYWDLYSRETAMRNSHLAWEIANRRFRTGLAPEQDVKQIEEQFHFFRGQRLDALGQGFGGRAGVLEAERRLRYMIGLPAEDGTRLIPSDTPTTAPVQPDWGIALSEAMSRRPELVQIRQEIQVAQLVILREKDALLPDLRFFSRYNINAIGSHLDGKDENSALRNLAEGRFNDYSLGLRLEMPLGYREAHSELKRAKLILAQRVAFLQEQEENLANSLTRSYREIVQRYEQILIQRARRRAAAIQLERRFQQFEAGKETVLILLDAQRAWADALREEFFAIYDYNVALIDFERQKGTIMQYNNVAIVEGQLPSCAQARASAHIRERSRSLVLKEAVNSSDGACSTYTYQNGSTTLPATLPAPERTIAQKPVVQQAKPVPQLGPDEPVALPQVIEKQPPPPEVLPPLVPEEKPSAANKPMAAPVVKADAPAQPAAKIVTADSSTEPPAKTRAVPVTFIIQAQHTDEETKEKPAATQAAAPAPKPEPKAEPKKQQGKSWRAAAPALPEAPQVEGALPASAPTLELDRELEEQQQAADETSTTDTDSESPPPSEEAGPGPAANP